MPPKQYDSSTAAVWAGARGSRGRWLLFVHQIPSRASKARVRTWRRLQKMGAIAVKQAVYVLPDSPAARERFEWLKSELDASGGEVTIFSADSVDKWSTDALVEAFRAARREDYEALRREIASIAGPAARQGRGRPPTDLAQRLERWQQRLSEIERIDYFSAPGRDDVRSVLASLDRALRGPASPPLSGQDESRAGYQGRVWVTRPRPGVDRMASAWLIRTRIDPRATFTFAADRDSVPDAAVAFDMYGVRFTHEAGGCTFETLCRAFGVRERAVDRMAALVHVLDVEDGAPMPPDGPTIERLVEGLQLAHADDQALLGHGIALFDALHRSFERQLPPSGATSRATSARRRTAGARPRGRS